ncbi:Membrane-associated protease RseP, regulator of RpoE activity [Nakamurella panacisegetis]|uniref:Membrane-associated protease RseP, regulator of RpoE activity n=1 Tax=Nakamurella panacisegetis TaxID=1090615 RepID=A0A1H0SKI7_9ACTN|nr:site-2 protease family protein [Nakamurella panacisegetis]SDP42220.1 Membrane-associated protease RseP, regulator of RpoE activity [Nakamurella panacisegetis]
MLTAIGVILFVLGLLFSIAWHELGHLAFAKLFGVRVTQYMVGFGRTLFSRQRGETEYGIKAIPLGGYIRMVGMVPPAAGKNGGRFRGPGTTAMGPAGMVRQLIEDSRSGDRSQVTEQDDGRQFYQLHPFKRIVVMFAGPFQNLILAVVLFIVIVIGLGVPVTVPTVATVSTCVLPATATKSTCAASDPATPAAQAGLKPGDKIVSFAGSTITSWDQMRELIRASAGKTVALTYERDGVDTTKQVPIVANTLAVLDDQGKQTGTTVGGFLGITAATEYQSQSVGEAFTMTGSFIGSAAHAVVSIPSRIPALWDSIFNGKARDQNSPVGIVGAGVISGEILSSDTAAKDKIELFLQLLAGFNMSLFLLNLLPLLPLDGGHILGAIIEWVRRGWSKVRRKADPGPFDVAKLMPVAYVVALLFIGLSVLTLVADVVNPVKLFG